MIVNKELAKARIDKGWSQRELAKHAGLAPSMICTYERYGREPLMHNQWKIANALGKKPWDLWGKAKNQNGGVIDTSKIKPVGDDDPEMSFPIKHKKKFQLEGLDYILRCDQCGKLFKIDSSQLKSLVNCPFCNNGRTFTHMYGWD